MIVHDSQNARAIAIRDSLEALRVDTPAEGPVVVIGGDGFLLQTAASLGWNRAYLGLNAGRLGFLLNDVDERTGDKIRAGAWSEWRFPLLKAAIKRADGSSARAEALNDVYLERMTGQTAHLEVQVNGRPIVERLVADGVIVATALGSTAYAYSAGGPACHPTLRMLCITPICPHQPRLSPLLVPEDTVVRIVVMDPDKRPVRCVADGRATELVKHVEINVNPHGARLAYFNGHEFTGRLVRKLIRTSVGYD